MTTRQQRRAALRAGESRIMAEQLHKEAVEAAEKAAETGEEVPKPAYQANRKARRVTASPRFRNSEGLPPLGDNPEDAPHYRPANLLNPVAGLKRRRRDNRIRSGTRESRGGPDAVYDDRTDHLILTHVTKGRRKFSRRRLELQAKMQRLLNPKLYREVQAQ